MNMRCLSASCLLLTLMSSCTYRSHPPSVPAPHVTHEVKGLWPKEKEVFSPLLPQVNKSIGTIDKKIKPNLDNGIVALVQDQIITVKEFDMHFFMRLQQLRKPPTPEVYFQVMDYLIDKILLTRKAKSLELVVTDIELREQIDKIISGDDKAFEQELDRRKMSVVEFEEMTREDMLAKKAEDHLYRGVFIISPQEVKEAYQDRQSEFQLPASRDLSVILLFKDQIKSDPNKFVKAIMSKYENGDDFNTLAKQYSHERLVHETGGRKKRVLQEDLNPEMGKIAYALKEGEVAAGEWSITHFIIRCDKIHQAGAAPYEEVQGMLRQQLRNQKFMKRKEEVRKQLREEAYIEILPPNVYLQYHQKKVK